MVRLIWHTSQSTSMEPFARYSYCLSIHFCCFFSIISTFYERSISMRTSSILFPINVGHNNVTLKGRCIVPRSDYYFLSKSVIFVFYSYIYIVIVFSFFYSSWTWAWLHFHERTTDLFLHVNNYSRSYSKKKHVEELLTFFQWDNNLVHNHV
jgi:hypothetical protein